MVLTIIFLWRLESMIFQFDPENSVDPRLCMKVCCGSLLCPKVELHFNIFHLNLIEIFSNNIGEMCC